MFEPILNQFSAFLNSFCIKNINKKSLQFLIKNLIHFQFSAFSIFLGRTLLHKAVASTNLLALQFLAKHGADVNRQDNNVRGRRYIIIYYFILQFIVFFAKMAIKYVYTYNFKNIKIINIYYFYWLSNND